jgi:hypothetical protein
MFAGFLMTEREKAQREKNAALLGLLAPITIAGRERQAAKDVRDVERFEEEPMIGKATWHVHGRDK